MSKRGYHDTHHTSPESILGEPKEACEQSIVNSPEEVNDSPTGEEPRREHMKKRPYLSGEKKELLKEKIAEDRAQGMKSQEILAKHGLTHDQYRSLVRELLQAEEIRDARWRRSKQ